MATIVASIEYLITEILLRLPVKSLLRFKCVSKEWLAFISEPKFCHSHTLRIYKNSSVIPSALFLSPKHSSICPIIPLKTNNVSGSSDFHNVEFPKGTVVQSCNGLVLIRRCTNQIFAHIDYFICNPTTNQTVHVISSISLVGPSQSHFIWFEPLKSPYYKLVSIDAPSFINSLLSDNEDKYNFSVYSSESKTWSESRFAFALPSDESPHFNGAVFVNGTLFWYTSNLKSFCYFNFETLSFKRRLMPLQFKKLDVLYFGFSGGHLITLLRSPRLPICLLKFNVENFKFTVLCKWKQLKASDVGEMPCLYSAVEEENNKDSIIVSYSNGRVISHNLTDSSDEVLFNFNSGQIPVKGKQIFPYYENLSCVGPCVVAPLNM